MQKSFSRSFSSLVYLLLLLPFLGLFIFLPGHALRLPAHTAKVLGFTIEQAFLSAVIAMTWGFVGALGLLSLKKARVLIEALILIPNIVPVLFVIVSFLNLMPNLRGLWGIVGLHALLNSGLVAVTVARLLLARTLGLAELAQVEGAKFFHFFWRGALPLIFQDLILIGLFVFTLSFVSFAVPLIIGGSRATTIEVLIYENVLSYSDWPRALSLALLQTAFIFALSFFLGREELGGRSRFKASYPLLEWRPGLIFILLPSALVICGLGLDLPSVFTKFSQNYEWFGSLLPFFANSLFVALSTGFLILFSLYLVAAANPQKILRQFLLGYVAPSAVLTGFAILIFWRASGFATLIKISLGLTLVSVPSFYRLLWDRALSSLNGQVQTAQTLGASEWLTFRKITAPQLWRDACRMAALASVWAWGDFALSRVMAEAPVTLALQVQSLMESYRLEAATWLVWILMLGGASSYIFFEGLGYVLRPKFES